MYLHTYIHMYLHVKGSADFHTHIYVLMMLVTQNIHSGPLTLKTNSNKHEHRLCVNELKVRVQIDFHHRMMFRQKI